MADESLQAALSGFNVTPAETYWGIGARGLGAALPSLIDPVYGDRGTNIGIALGGALLQGLLGYQAKRQAAKDTFELNTFAKQMQSLSTPQARTEFISGISDPTAQSKLLTLSNALNIQQAARNLEKEKFRQQLMLKGVEQGYIPSGYEDIFKTTAPEVEQPKLGTDAVTGESSIKIPTTINGMPLTPKDRKDLQKKAIEVEMGEAAKAPERKEEFFNREYTRLKPAGEEYSKVAQQFLSAVDLAKQDTIASAQALAKLMVKIPDPTSVVSRAEQNAAADVQDVRRKYSNLIEQWVAGGSGFDQQAYDDMLRAARVFVDASGNNYNTLAQGSITRAKKRKYIQDETEDLSDFLPVPLYNPTQIAFDRGVKNKQTELQQILQQLQKTTDPVAIRNLKQQAADIYGKK